MACEVTEKDIQNRIKNELLDKFDNIKFTKYSDRLAGFIPYDANNPSKSSLYGKVKKIESQYNSQYHATQYGTVVSLNQMKDGVELNIHPSRKLASAMSLQNQSDESFSKYEGVAYKLKAVEILSSNRAVEIFNKGERNNWSLDKILTELSIPKEQKQLIFDSGKTNREDILLDLASNYSYTIKVDITKDKKYIDYQEGAYFVHDGYTYENLQNPVSEELRYYKVKGTDPENDSYDREDYIYITQEEFDNTRKLLDNSKNSSYYSNLTVPGGANYTEQEISTPLIIPSIKGHAQFSTDNGIGWFRSDELTSADVNNRIERGEPMNVFDELAKSADELKTRRILELQSDLFQKGRDKDNLDKNRIERIQPNPLMPPADSGNILPDTTSNKFLQLLNKDNNWVTFFVKSIIQDSAKKGYEKVLFPSGDTASKVEGHTTLEEFKRQKEDRIKQIKQYPEVVKNGEYFIPGTDIGDAYLVVTDKSFNLVSESDYNDNWKHGQSLGKHDTIKILKANKFDNALELSDSQQNEINQLKQELENVEGPQGFGALKPIYNFYENQVQNILKKQGYNPIRTTDEYGNGWFEVKLDNQKAIQDSNEFSFSRFEQREVTKPVTDNFIEYKNYKESQLTKVKQALKTLYKDRRNPKKNISTIAIQIDRLTNIEAKIKNDIDSLNKNDINLMFHAIDSDITDLNKVLDNASYKDNKFDMDEIKDRLEFLYQLVKGVSLDNKVQPNRETLASYNHPDFAKVSLAVDELNLKYKDKLNQLRDVILESDISYVNNVINNKALTTEDIASMFENKKDINWLEKTFLGITSSSTDDGVFTQVLKSTLETKVALREAEVKTFQDKLALSIRKLDKKGFDFIFEKSEAGNKTGNIINVISPAFNKKLYEYKKINSNSDLTDEQKYKDKVEWLKKNTEVIDFRKIKSVKDLYEDMYGEHFKFSEAEMLRYENYLGDMLGPLYEEEISKVLNSLENFQIQKESLLSDTNNRFRHRDVAKVDPWAFISNYNSPNSAEKVNFRAGGINTESVYSDVQNIRFAPIKDIYVTFDSTTGDEIYADSGYYNKDFNEVLQDPDKLEYWQLMKEIYSDYINPLYNESDISDMSYAKFENEFLETIAQAKKLQKGSKLFTKSLHAFKEMFYERGRDFTKDGISKNYSDRSKREISELTQALVQKGRTYTQAREEATASVLKSYSTDINKVTSALLEMSALQKAKQDTMPIANLIVDSHKLIKSEKGEERKRSIERLENWVARVIKGENEKYRGSASFLGDNLSKGTWFAAMINKMSTIPFIKKYVDNKKGHLLTDNEKELLKHLTSLKEIGHNKGINTSFKVDGVRYVQKQTEDGPQYYEVVTEKDIKELTEEQFEAVFQKHIENKIEELGLDLNTAGIIQGILKVIIVKGLGLNPISGIFNRIEGKNSGLVMDKTGKYWKSGNIAEANNFMAFANFIKFLPERFTPEQSKKVQELQKLQVLVHNMNLIQDRKNELERHADKSQFDYEKLTNIYQFAVENPEFKNQGAILLSVLMDTKIKDIGGNERPIFDGKQFPAYDNINGKLVLKPEFRTVENISNWENFDIDEVDLTNNQYLLTKNKIKHAISRSQGNYDNLDVIDATKNIWGRAMTLFMKWMPEHAMQRFSKGEGIDIINDGKKKQTGRYRTLAMNNPALITGGALTLFTGFGLTPLSAIAGLGLTGFVAAKYFYDLYSGEKGIQREANNTKEFIDFAQSIVVETLNYPLEAVNSKLKIKNTAYKNSNMSSEEVGNLQAIAKELGIKLTFMAMLLLIKKLTWDDDDDKKSKRREFHNFADNQLTRMIGSISNWTNPQALSSDVQRLAFLKYLWDAGKLMNTIATADAKKDFKENVFKVSPLPRILNRDEMPWYDKKEFETTSWIDKYIKGGGPKAALKKFREDKEKEIKAELDEKDLTPAKYEKELRKRMRDEVPTKSKDMTYKEVMELIKEGEDGKSVRRKRKVTKEERDDRKEELKNEGYEDDEIYEIMKDEFSSR